MKKIVVISIILENPNESQGMLNEIISNYKNVIKGRMGLPIENLGIGAVSLTTLGTMDQINSLTGKLGNLPNVTISTAVSKKNITD